jgi:hypothetical protein
MILNKPQAEAVYSAMCALNNVSGLANFRFPDTGRTIHVTESVMGDGHLIQIYRGDAIGNPTGDFEQFTSQADFATAYGL